MMHIKKIILLLSVSILCMSSAMAKCNFGINIGDKYPEKFEENFGPLEPSEFESLHFTYFEATEICNSSALKDILVEFTFLYGELASIKMIAMNDEKNIPTKKLTLMNYAKTNYGNFDTGFDKQNYNNFNVWKKNKSFVIYSRIINNKNIWDEEIYITNEKYDELLVVEKNFEEDNIKLIEEDEE